MPIRSHSRGAVPPDAATNPGFSGDHLSQRRVAGRVAAPALTRWQSPDPVRAFTGDDRAAAILGPASAALLLDSNNTVQQNEIPTEASDFSPFRGGGVADGGRHGAAAPTMRAAYRVDLRRRSHRPSNAEAIAREISATSVA